jgi:hypothetical protein
MVPVGVKVPLGMGVVVAAAMGPVMPLFQVPQLVAMNRTGVANTSSVKINFLLLLSDGFLLLENMVPLFGLQAEG